MKPIWSTEIPTTPGYHWFFGVMYDGVPGQKPAFQFVRVGLLGDKTPTYVVNGHFWYPDREAVPGGSFAPVEFPEPPEATS